ncbi:MAG: hypothetical protein NTY09_03935 [bacterium]|nr:hypothetical protein [bacterium]
MRNILILGLAIAALFIASSCGGGGGDTVTPTDDFLRNGKNDLLAGNGDSAKSNFSHALAESPNNPDANFGMFVVELMSEANDLVDFLSVQNDPYFKNVTWFAFGPVVDSTIQQGGMMEMERVLGVSTDDIVVDDITLAEIQAHINTMLVHMDQMSNYLEVTVAQTASNPNWSFVILKDWNDPSAGTVTIIRGDVMALNAALNFLMGLMHFSVAYSPANLGIHQNEWGDYEITGADIGEPASYVDTNSNGYIDLGEIADQCGYPSGFGVKNADGASHLAILVSNWNEAFTYARDALDQYAAMADPLNHWVFEGTDPADFTEMKDDWLAYGSDYANDLISSFNQTTTLKFYPAHLADDPGVSGGLGDNFTVDVNFVNFFNNMPDNLRDFPVRFVDDGSGGIKLPASVNEAFTDTTVLGLFPNGLPQELFDELYM